MFFLFRNSLTKERELDNSSLSPPQKARDHTDMSFYFLPDRRRCRLSFSEYGRLRPYVFTKVQELEDFSIHIFKKWIQSTLPEVFD